MSAPFFIKVFIVFLFLKCFRQFRRGVEESVLFRAFGLAPFFRRERIRDCFWAYFERIAKFRMCSDF